MHARGSTRGDPRETDRRASPAEAVNAWESLRMAWVALRLNPLRTSLATLGIVVGVTAVVAMLAIGSGSHAKLERQLQSLGANLLYVLPRGDGGGGTPAEAAGRRPLTEADAAAILREIPAIDVAVSLVSDEIRVVRGNRNRSTTVAGTRRDFLVAREWEFAEGANFRSDDIATAAKVAVLGATVAETLFHDSPALGSRIRIQNVPFTVIGVLRAKGQDPFGWDQDDVVYVPITTAKLRVMGSTSGFGRRAVGLILVKVHAQARMDDAAEAIRQLLRARHRLPPRARNDYTVRDMQALIEKRDEAARTLTIQLASLASVAMLVGGIAIMNIMIVSVTERTREIGLRLAVGARRRDVRNQFLVEALTVCLVGGAAGTALGVALAVAMATFGDWPVIVSPVSILLALGAAAGVGLFFGLYPALQAARLDPIDALRRE